MHYCPILDHIYFEEVPTMLKRILALMLCVLMLVPVLVSCSDSEDDGDLGAYITMYLTDEIYDFDPLSAYYNRSTFNVVSMMYDTLFVMTEKGEIKPSLVEEYKKIENKDENEYGVELTLKEAYWSDGSPITADDVIFAWKRLLNVNSNYEAAALLFDIKNARAVKQGDISIDDLGLEAVKNNLLKITFEGPADYDQFFLNLTNIVTAPLSESMVSKDADWAKKSATIRTSGAFKLGKTVYERTTDGTKFDTKDKYAFDEKGNLTSTTAKGAYEKKISSFILERNRYYQRDDARDSLKKSVKSYRILVDCTKTESELMEDYKAGKLFYIGDIPYALRTNDTYKGDLANVTTRDSLSTLVLYLNQNALINNGADGEKLFKNQKVREALSEAIDREALASMLVYAEAATGLVPNGVISTYKKKKSPEFRDETDAILATKKNTAKAQELLKGIDTSKYSFSITVAKYDKANVAVANAVKDAWCALGFKVTLNEVTSIQNNDVLKLTGAVSEDICDDQFTEAIQRNDYEVIIADAVSFSADAYGMLACYAKAFSGMPIDMDSDDYALVPHRTGYDSETYNNIIEAVYYVPYFASLNENSHSFLGIYKSKADFQAVYNAVNAVYNRYGIEPTKDSSKWAAQKAQLLKEAEKVLMNDLPVIPLVFNKDATLTSSQLKDVAEGFYTPFNFAKTDLKDYNDYTYENEEGEKISIFATFPTIQWDKIGK